LQPPDHLDERERHIFDKLAAQLEPTRLEVQDVSGGCGSMYAIEIASTKFKGLSMLKQHRLVQEILAEEIKGWHGVQLRTEL
ncbi:bola-like protein, partial [Kalaharituber pfeilii]